jgi:hypothetical protein
MGPEVLSRHAVNRALLARQQLLSRPPDGADGPDGAGRVIAMVEHLVGMQAQAPFPPYYGLLARLDGFRAADLAGLLLGRDVVRIALMRGTIHLVSARDCLLLRPLLQPVLDRALSHTFGRQLAGADVPAVAEAGRVLAEQEPRTFAELGSLLAGTWPDHPPPALAQAPGIPRPKRGSGVRSAGTPRWPCWSSATWPPSARPRCVTCRPGPG